MFLARTTCRVQPTLRAANAGLVRVALARLPQRAVVTSWSSATGAPSGRAHFSASPGPSSGEQQQPAASTTGGHHKTFSGVRGRDAVMAPRSRANSRRLFGNHPLCLPRLHLTPLLSTPPHPPNPCPQPVSWATLALVVVAGAGVVIYNNVAREKKKSEGEWLMGLEREKRERERRTGGGERGRLSEPQALPSRFGKRARTLLTSAPSVPVLLLPVCSVHQGGDVREANARRAVVPRGQRRPPPQLRPSAPTSSSRWAKSQP
jgi:hypothetical protein